MPRRTKGKGRRVRRTALAALAMLAIFFSACGQASSPAERQERQGGVEQVKREEAENIPTYDVTLEQDCSQDYPYPTKCYSVTTTATSTENLEALTRQFAEESPEYLAVVVTFYPPRQTADTSGTGFFFDNGDVARSIISQMYQNPEEANVDDQVSEAMQNDGIYVIAVAEEVESMTREMCAEWDTTTLGTPPPEWNCPGN